MDVRRVMPTGPYAPLFRFMYGFDLPYNLVPSLHIAQGILLWVIYARHTRGGVRCLLALWFLLVGVSTLFTWQHRTPDLITGAMLGVLCLYLFPERVDDRQDGERPARNPAVGARWGVAAALLVILAWLIGGWGWLLLWPAFSAGAVAFAYVAGGPRVFCKHAGRLPMPTRLVLLPTLLAGHVAWRHLRRPSRPWVQVLPNLYIGRRLNNREALALRQEGVAAVLDLTAECSECRELLRVPYLNLPLLDLTVPTAGQFDEAVRFIREGVGSGGVYVHCALGYSRAAVVVCAYLLAEGLSSDPVSAIAVVRGVRPQIVLKEDSLEALRNYASKIVKQQWVPLAASRIGNAR
jgi:protein-tyrosine phosphatase